MAKELKDVIDWLDDYEKKMITCKDWLDDPAPEVMVEWAVRLGEARETIAELRGTLYNVLANDHTVEEIKYILDKTKQ